MTVTNNAIADLQAALDEAEDDKDALLARLADIEIAASGGEAVPIELVRRLSEGENPVRVWREYRGLSLRALARQVGISAALLSQIETGERDGSIRTLAALARALSVAIDDLLSWQNELGDDADHAERRSATEIAKAALRNVGNEIEDDEKGR
jgi:transcriptional regulator with XRE-family HTH domain